MTGSTDSADLDSRKDVPRIVVAVAHPTMRRYLCDLIEQSCRCWLATTSSDADELQAALGTLRPDVLVVDHALRPINVHRPQAAFPAAQVLVIGPEPDPAYRAAAIGGGAGAWLSRDDLETELVPELARLLAAGGYGCGCEPPA